MFEKGFGQYRTVCALERDSSSELFVLIGNYHDALVFLVGLGKWSQNGNRYELQ